MEQKTSGQPKYKRIAQHLQREIEAGRFAVQERLPSFTEMRAQFGATPTTANLVYGVLEQQGLIVREPGRGIFVAEPPRPARTLSTIGIVGNAFTEENEVPYWAYLVQGVRKAAAQAEVEILLFNEEHPASGWEKVDGVLVCVGADELQPVLPPGLACVSLINPARQVTSVMADDYDGVRLAMEHLLELGHRRIGFLLPTPQHVTYKPRLASYRAALRKAGVEPQKSWVRSLSKEGWKNCNNFGDLGRSEMKHWLEDDWHKLGCTAFLTVNDEMAIGAIETLQGAGIRVPDDVSVVGFDGTQIGEYFRPRLTSVKMPLRQIGERGVELLLDQIRGEDTAAQSEVLPMKLLVRDSTRRIQS